MHCGVAPGTTCAKAVPPMIGVLPAVIGVVAVAVVVEGILLHSR